MKSGLWLSNENRVVLNTSRCVYNTSRMISGSAAVWYRGDGGIQGLYVAGKWWLQRQEMILCGLEINFNSRRG